MYVAITGATGRIGRCAVETLSTAGHRVRAIDRVPTEHADFVRADMTDYDQFHSAVRGTDALIHLAGIPNPARHPGHVVHNTNVVGSFNALRAAVDLGINTICLASSINAIGGAFSRRARYDYFPVDEQHPTYNEDSYSLSKWIAEHQADSFARRYANLTIASLRIHAAVPDRASAQSDIAQTPPDMLINHLWGYVRLDAVARALLLVLDAPWTGHEVFNIVAQDTVLDRDSRELARQHWPDVPIRRELPGNSGFYACDKAERMLGWRGTI